jgi:hypothetical protein
MEGHDTAHQARSLKTNTKLILVPLRLWLDDGLGFGAYDFVYRV